MDYASASLIVCYVLSQFFFHFCLVSFHPPPLLLKFKGGGGVATPITPSESVNVFTLILYSLLTNEAVFLVNSAISLYSLSYLETTGKADIDFIKVITHRLKFCTLFVKNK